MRRPVSAFLFSSLLTLFPIDGIAVACNLPTARRLPMISTKALMPFISSLLLACLFLSVGVCANAQELSLLCKSSEVIEEARAQLDRDLFAQHRPNLAIKIAINNATLDRVAVQSKEGVVKKGAICRADIDLTVNERHERLSRGLIYEVDSATGQVGVSLSSISSIEKQFAARLNASSEKAGQDYAKKLCSDVNVFRGAQKQLSELLASVTKSSETRFSASNPAYEGSAGPAMGQSGPSGPSIAICKSDIKLTLNGHSAFLQRLFVYYVSMDNAQQVRVERDTASALIRAFDREITRKEGAALHKSEKPNGGSVIQLK